MFEIYPDIKKAYNLTHKLRVIFTQTKTKEVAYTKLSHRFKDTGQTHTL